MKLIACLAFLGISFSAAAQHHWGKDKKDKFLPQITRTLGVSIQKFDGLNDRLAGLTAYKPLKNAAATLGLGWLMEHDRFLSGAGITIGSSMSGDRDEKSSTIRYISLNADLGYDIVKTDKITFYPLIGLGVQKYQAIFFKDNSGVDFDDVLTSPEIANSISPVKFKNGFLVYQAGLGVSFRSPKYPAASIGIRAGYTGSFKKNDWRSNDSQVLDNAPLDRISQFYVSVILTSKPWMMMKK